MPIYLPQGYKTSTRTKVEGIASTGQVSAKGTVAHTEHWSGRVDARVSPAPLLLKLTQADGAPFAPAYLEAIGQHQTAIDELKLARASGHVEWIKACEARVAYWKQAIIERQ